MTGMIEILLVLVALAIWTAIGSVMIGVVRHPH
jgi:hypothetical protein